MERPFNPLVSRTVKGARWESEVLEIAYHSDIVRVYQGVPIATWHRFLVTGVGAPGLFVDTELKGLPYTERPLED